MIAYSTRGMWRHPVAWTAAVYGLLVYLTLPTGVVALNDDFGYLRSTIETFRYGRPWTNDWLEPWAASLSIVSALAFKLTGSFHVAVQGVQAFFAASAVVGAYAVFRDRGLSEKAGIVGALLLVSMPTLLWKSVEYTGVTLYLPCLVWAIWAAGRRRWLIFFIFWAIAFASRQSALTWLALPACAIVVGWKLRRDQPGAWAPPLLVLGAALGVFAALSLAMNKTHAQAMITDQLAQRIEFAKALSFFAVGSGVMAICVGLGAWAGGGCSIGFPSMKVFSARIFCVLVAAAIGLAVFDAKPVLFFEHSAYEGISGDLYLKLAGAIAVAGWIAGGFSIRIDLLVAGLGSLLLICLRTAVWDYYLMDAAVFAFFCVGRFAMARTAAAEFCWPRWIRALVAGTAAVFHFYLIWVVKCRVDRDYATIVVAEKARRSGELKVTELGFAPYGFIGWHLHPYYVSSDGAHEVDTGGFMRYLKPASVEARFSPLRFWKDSHSLRPISADDASRLVGTEVFRVGWFWNQRVSLLRVANTVRSATLPMDATRYVPQIFPLNDAEWRKIISPPSAR